MSNEHGTPARLIQRVQAISYSVTREKAPIYTMGSPDVRSFSRNKRGVAGSLIWINFDRHALLNLVHRLRGRFIANVDDIRPQFRADLMKNQQAIFASSLVRDNGIPVGATYIEEVFGEVGVL